MATFEPIAIVGHGCVIPGANNPDALWELVCGNQDTLRDVATDFWGTDATIVTTPERPSGDKTWTTRGSYVDFDAVDADLEELDPLFAWSFEAARQAFVGGTRGGVVLGNLSYPTHGMSRFCESVWKGEQPGDARDRFMSNLPAEVIRDRLGLTGEAYGLDAACASSLYAIKLACDALHDGRADVMLAGGVNRADDLFLHVGFCALNAMSRTGQSRPFHKDADGLIPAEGAAFVCLKRLDDAVKSGDPILGVIRSIGLSNDGRSSGMLSPSVDGQVRAMKDAYTKSDIDPDTLQLIECHATGTPVGDALELQSMGQVFADAIPIGSMKSHVGHLITASGAAGLIKVLKAMEHGLKPPTLHASEALEKIGEVPFRILNDPEPWTDPVKRAAINNFGFGGNNAHLIVESYEGQTLAQRTTPSHDSAKQVGKISHVAGFVGGNPLTESGSGRCESIDIDISKLKFPPNDLDVMLPQQIAVLAVAMELSDVIATLPKERTGVFIGMQTETEIARYGARWRNDNANDGVVTKLSSAGVLGTMPNIVANRLNTQFDLCGPSFSISAGTQSAKIALDVAKRAIETGEIDAAIVGAVELGSDPVHKAALRGIGIEDEPVDACVLFVLGRDGVEIPEAGAHNFGYSHVVDYALGVVAELQQTAPNVIVSNPASGLTKSYAAHWPAVRFDTARTKRPVFGATQTMPAAPTIPQVADVSAWQQNLMAYVVSDTNGVVTHEPSVAPTPRVAETSAVLAANDAVSELFAEVSQMHGQFLAEQTAMHQRFLQIQNAMMDAIRGAEPQVELPVSTSPAPIPQPIAARNPAQSAPVFEPKPIHKVEVRQAVDAPKPVVESRADVGLEQPTTPAVAPTQKELSHKIVPSAQKPKPSGPTFDAEQIRIHASGKISEIYGPLFAQQDDFPVQVRMPEPPLLLCHRVTGIDCEPGVVGKGTLWSESDIAEDAWYLHAGRMPVGIMIESGQADLMLCSWMGADFENKGDRCYRLLGCELMFHGGLAKPGDTLKYDIHIDGHAQHDDVRLFFFHYDLEIDNQVRLSVRQGQAGFFTYDELAESKGILWKPTDEDVAEIEKTRFDAPPCVTAKRSFDRAELERFAAGETYNVFGTGFERAAAHSASPRISGGKMLFMDDVDFDPEGGPWGRGYLRAVQNIQPDDWFFPGHFKNDPCMPGTLMFEGAIQTMALYMAATGWTIDRDGWIFEPVKEIPYLLRCRGQVSTTSRELVYELFVREVHDDIEGPKLFGDLLCTVDGLPAFHCGSMGLQLTPSWPMDLLSEQSHGDQKDADHKLVDRAGATAPAVVNGFEFGLDSLIACAWGTPSRAFGPMYEPFDSHRTVARLPGPPYHFMTRITEVDPEAQNAMRSGAELTVEYDVPSDAWYFEENGAAVMPYAVILEAALQPCGWLASYVGCALTRDDIDLCFRNLDGTTTQFVEVTPDTGTLKTKATLTNIARAGGNIIVAFDVEMSEAKSGEVVLTMDTVFGFFPPESLAEQVGLPVPEEEKEKHDQASNYDVLFSDRAPEYFEGPALANPMLLMIDHVDYWDPDGGSHQLGRARATKQIDPNEWFFKAHFFQDPVQPGSLGLEALLQLLQFAMLEKGLASGIENPRFEGIATHQPMTWKYRGQVLTHNKEVRSTIDLVDIGSDARGVFAIAEGSLWVDGMRIYQAKNIGMRIVSGDRETARWDSDLIIDTGDFVIDPDIETWLVDHCPTYTRPALPAMSIVDYMAQAVEQQLGQTVIGLSNVAIQRWAIFDGAERFRIEIEPTDDRYLVTLEMWRVAAREELSRFETVATALVDTGSYQRSDVSRSEIVGESVEPYATKELFHGPAFQMLTTLERNDSAAVGTIDVSKNGVPSGAVQPGLLDAALQIIPHDHLNLWHDVDDVIAYPHSVERMTFHTAAPQHGTLRSEARFVSGDERFATFEIRVFTDDELWMSMTLTEVLVSKGPLGKLPGKDRHAFIAERKYVEGARLSPESGELDRDTIRASNWFRGTVESIYDVGGLIDVVANEIVVKDRAAANFKIHPSQFDVVDGRAVPKFAPVVGFGEDRFGHVQIAPIKRWWRDKLGVPVGWLGDDLYGAMIDRFVDQIRFEDVGAFESIRGRSVLFLGNHEVQIESIIITMLASVLSDTVVVTMANAKHEKGWVGSLIRDLFSYPGCEDPKNIVYFDQSKPESMLDLIAGFKADVSSRGASVMVHAPGTRAVQADQPVEQVSSALVDMALELQLPIVPVYFSGGLPVEPLSFKKLEFPIGQTGQTYTFGTPIDPEALGAMMYKDRRTFVLDAINRLAPEVAAPNPPVAKYIREVAKLQADGWDEINATLYNILTHVEAPDRDAAMLVSIFSGKFEPKNERDQWLIDFVTRRFRM